MTEGPGAARPRTPIGGDHAEYGHDRAATTPNNDPAGVSERTGGGGGRGGPIRIRPIYGRTVAAAVSAKRTTDDPGEG
jgi:hypothetical protein